MSDTTTPTPMPVTWFEIGTPDPDAARAFYGEVFGWTFATDQDYVLVTTGGEAPTGGIQDTTLPIIPPGQPDHYAVFVVQVPDVAAACKTAEAAGGEILLPTQTAPDGLTYAHLRDPAGSHFGVWCPPPASG
jgi:uncharacterized protein